MFKYIAIILITVSLFCSCAQQKETTSAIPVILDTDVGNDIDDVLAMQMLLNYEKKGKIDLLGITISKCNLIHWNILTLIVVSTTNTTYL